MTLHVLTDHGAITARLDSVLAADPVGATMLGTIRMSLEPTAWAAVGDGRLAVRSSDAYPVVLAGDWPAAAQDELVPLLAGLAGLRGLSGRPAEVAALAAAVLGTDRPAEEMGQGLYRLDDLTPPVGVAGHAAPASEPHREVARAWFSAFFDEAGGPSAHPRQMADHAVDGGGLWLWFDGGEPVSMAPRRPVVAGSARIGPVYTPPARRGHGYGAAATAAATRSILDQAAIPVLFTDLANPTSNRIYQRLGYRLVEERLVVSFSRP